MYLSGADPGFHLGGGGGAQKIMCPHALHERDARRKNATTLIVNFMNFVDQTYFFILEHSFSNIMTPCH